MFYYVMFFCALLSAFLESVGSKKASLLKSRSGSCYSLDSFCFAFVAVYLFFFAALRHETFNGDTRAYIRAFKRIGRDITDTGWEKFYVYMNYFFYSISSHSFYIMQSVIALFTSLAFYNHIKTRSLSPCYTLFFYLINQFLIIQTTENRQALAMAVLVLGHRFIEKRSLVKWIITVILAMQFHVGAILGLPLYISSGVTIKPWFATLMFLASVWITYFGLNLAWTLLDLVVALGFLPARLHGLVIGYMSGSSFSGQAEFGTGLGYLLKTFFHAYLIFLYMMSPEADRKKCYMFNFCIALILRAFSRNFELFRRIVSYYDVCGLGLATYGLFITKNKFFKKTEYFQLTIMCLFLAFTVWSNLRNIYELRDDGSTFNEQMTTYTPFFIADD